MAALAGLKENSSSSSRSRSQSMSATASATLGASPAVEAGSGMGAVEELNQVDDDGGGSPHETATADRAEGLRRAEMMAAAFANAPHALTQGTSPRASCLFYLILSLTLLAVSL